MFSRQHCPLLQRRLSLFMKLMYCSGVWSYVVGALTTPTYILIPVLTVYAGIFPIVVSWWAAGEECCLLALRILPACEVTCCASMTEPAQAAFTAPLLTLSAFRACVGLL